MDAILTLSQQTLQKLADLQCAAAGCEWRATARRVRQERCVPGSAVRNMKVATRRKLRGPAKGGLFSDGRGLSDVVVQAELCRCEETVGMGV